MNLRKIIREEINDFDWIRDQTPIQLEDPKNWVGRTFGYGESIRNTFDEDDLDADETYTITSVDTNRGHLMLRKNHPALGQSDDIGTKISLIRKYIDDGSWVWVD